MGQTLSFGVLFFTLQLFNPLAASANGVRCDSMFLASPPVLLSPLESAARFRDYFTALNETLVERQEVLHLIQVALIAQEHVLLMGPPGNAKSMVADMVLGGITEKATGEKSYYRIQMTPETSMSETHGPINPKEIFESGKIVREYDQGMLFSRNVFIDEIFDARANAQRNILGLLAERQHAQGTEIVSGNIETVIGATNRYLDEVYDKAGDQGPKALLDRFSFNIYVPGEFHLSSSYNRLINSSKKDRKPLPKLTFDDLEMLRTLVKDVEITQDVGQFLSLLSFRMKSQTEAMEQAELKNYRKRLQQGENPNPPYRATKYHSPRTLFKAAGILKAFVVHDWVLSGGTRPLTTTIEDIKMLKDFFVLSGPEQSFVLAMLERTSNPYERSQLSTIIEESKMFEDIYREISSETNDVIYKYALEDLEHSVLTSQTKEQKQAMILNLVKIWIETREASRQEIQADMSGREIGYAVVATYVEQKLRQIAGSDFENVVQKKVLEIEAAQREAFEQQRLAEKKQREEIERQARELVAKQKRAELDKKIDQYLAHQGLEALKDISNSFLTLADFPINKTDLPTGNKFFVHEKMRYLKSGEDVYAFESGETGYVIKRDGTTLAIEYKDVADSVLRDLLMSDSTKIFEKIDETTLLISDHTGVAQIVGLPDLKVMKTFLLKNSNEVFLDKNKEQMWAISSSTQELRRVHIKTGKTDVFKSANLQYFTSQTLSSKIIQVGADEFYLVINEPSQANLLWSHLNISTDTNVNIAWQHTLPGARARSENPLFVANGSDQKGLVYVRSGNDIIPLNLNLQNTKDSTKIENDPLAQPITITHSTGKPLATNLDIYFPQNEGYLVVREQNGTLQVYDIKAQEFIKNENPLQLDTGSKTVTEIFWVDSETLLVKYVDQAGNPGIRLLKLKSQPRSTIEALIKKRDAESALQNEK